MDARETSLLAGTRPDHANVVTGTAGDGVQFHLGPARNKGIAAAAGAIPPVISGGLYLGLMRLSRSLWFSQTDVHGLEKSEAEWLQAELKKDLGA